MEIIIDVCARSPSSWSGARPVVILRRPLRRRVRVGAGLLSRYFSDDDEVDGGEQPEELNEPGRILISEFRSDHYPLIAG
jgi:hypothetical protein